MTPEQSGALDALEALYLHQGITLLDEHKAAIESSFAQLAPEIIDGIVAAVNSRLTDGGLTGLVESKIKAIDVAAEGSLDKAAQSALDGVLAKIDQIATAEVQNLTAAEGTAPAAS